MSPRATILALGVCHLCGGVAAAILSADQPAFSSAILVALIFCQTSLLGAWCGLGPTYWLFRLIGLAGGAAYLAIELGLGIGELEGEIILLVVVATGVVAGVTWVFRLLNVVISRLDSNEEDAREGLQFSIRHLLLLTLAVACLLTVGRLLAPVLIGIEMLADVIVLALCYSAVSLTSLWAILGLGHPGLRVFVVFFIAVGAGYFAGYTVDNEIVFWVSTTVLQAVLLLLSLTVVRQTGYRVLIQNPRKTIRRY